MIKLFITPLTLALLFLSSCATAESEDDSENSEDDTSSDSDESSERSESRSESDQPSDSDDFTDLSKDLQDLNSDLDTLDFDLDDQDQPNPSNLNFDTDENVDDEAKSLIVEELQREAARDGVTLSDKSAECIVESTMSGVIDEKEIAACMSDEEVVQLITSEGDLTKAQAECVIRVMSAEDLIDLANTSDTSTIPPEAENCF